MFHAIGRIVYHARFHVLTITAILFAVFGIYGLGLPKDVGMTGFYDDNSESVVAAKLLDQAYGRDAKGDIVMMVSREDGGDVLDPAFKAEVAAQLDTLASTYDDKIDKPIGFATLSDTIAKGTQLVATADDGTSWGIVAIPMKSGDDTQRGKDYLDVQDHLRLEAPAVTKLAGLSPITTAITDGVAEDTHKAEFIALPLVAIVLFLVFGSVVAAALPVIVGVASIGISTGLVRLLTHFTDINFFASPIISLIGLGIAIDYGLFIVSRFREELAAGYDTPTAVRRSVMTAGRTVMMSALLIVGALLTLLIAPLGFLKSMAYGAFIAVAASAILSVTILPAMLAVLGPRVDWLSFKFLRRTKTKEQVERGFWGKVADLAMKWPAWVGGIVILLLLALIIPAKNLEFGGISEKYLEPGNPTRAAQEQFDELFPTQRTEPIKVVIVGQTPDTVVKAIPKVASILDEVPGFTASWSDSVSTGTRNTDAADKEVGLQYGGESVAIYQASNGLIERNTAREAVEALRDMDGRIREEAQVTILVTGTPALEADSMTGMFEILPWIVLMLVIVTTLLMFLAFGSLILPIKAVLLSFLSLGSTLGILTWMFFDGHGADLFSFTPGPLMAPVLVLIVAIVFGLSTDYEVFLISRMIEERAHGASTEQAIRAGTANTGRIITAAALILIVVTAAFGLSSLVVMKYIAFGLIAALILDATVVRMLLVPAVMKLLGDDSWWAPTWMRKIQEKIGLGEVSLPVETPDGRPLVAQTASASASAAANAVRRGTFSRDTAAQEAAAAARDAQTQRVLPQTFPAPGNAGAPGPNPANPNPGFPSLNKPGTSNPASGYPAPSGRPRRLSADQLSGPTVGGQRPAPQADPGAEGPGSGTGGSGTGGSGARGPLSVEDLLRRERGE